MKFVHKGKTYDVIKVNGDWRVYSTDMKFTVEEAREVMEELNKEEELVALEMADEEFFLL